VKAATVQVEGVKYRWRIYRQPKLVSGPGVLGLALLVESMEDSARGLVLQFSINKWRHHGMPHHQRFRVSDRRLIECIQNAIKAGWDPNSRGKLFVFEAGPVISS
jgi:hypothetical protein